MAPTLTYSLLALCGAAFVGSFFLDRKSMRAKWPRVRHVATAMQVLAFVAAYFVLRPGRGDDARARIAESTAHHAPILLDVYSNY
jgi:hypothetical protein